MYASLNVHILPLLHYLLAFFFLFILLPSGLFKTKSEDLYERIFSGYVKTILFIIISGYFLVITKLYEVIALLILFLSIIIYNYFKHTKLKQKSSQKVVLLKGIFDFLDGVFISDLTVLKAQVKQKVTDRLSDFAQRLSWNLTMEVTILVIMMVLTGYLRFYDAFTRPAPPMADSYVTLAWMKYIDGRQLFHDGIYPQGFHIYLATLFKFAAIDPFFVLRYTGPLNALLLISGYYFVIRKLTNNGIGALVAVFVAGVLPAIFPFYSIERQAATNSQEFAFVFIFPAIYFFYKYLIDKESENLRLGLISTAIIGFVHTLAFALVGIMIGLLSLSALFTLRRRWNQIVWICSGAVGTVLISLIPIGLGLLFGYKFHESSAEYLVEKNKTAISFPVLNHLDILTLSLLLVLLVLLFHRKLGREARFIGLFTVLMGISLFSLYYFGGVLTQSTLITSRSIELWAITIPFCIGMTLSVFLNRINRKFLSSVYLFLLLGFSGAIFIYNPNPVIPYKLEHGENIEQYLRISNKHLPKTWLIVSQNEGYALALGSGFHMHLEDFLDYYDPLGLTLTKIENQQVDKNLPPYIYIFMEKKVFKVSKKNSIYTILEPEYKQRERDNIRLKEWIHRHKQNGNKVDTFFENNNIAVFKLEMPKSKTPISKEIWRD